MRPMRSRIREHQHMGLRQDRQADIQRQPFLRQHNRKETESHMEKINLSEAIEKLAIAHGIAREEIEAVLEYYQAQQPQDVPKFDIDDYCNRYNIEYYIDPDIREETREQHKLHLHHSSKSSQAATAKRKSRQPKGNTWIWNRIRSRPNTKHGYH